MGDVTLPCWTNVGEVCGGGDRGRAPSDGAHRTTPNPDAMAKQSILQTQSTSLHNTRCDVQTFPIVVDQTNDRMPLQSIGGLTHGEAPWLPVKLLPGWPLSYQ